MPSLTVRNIPEQVIKRLRNAAREQKRSINSEAVLWLERAARDSSSREDVAKLFRKIRASRRAILRRHGLGTDSVEIIRQMREERARHGE